MAKLVTRLARSKTRLVKARARSLTTAIMSKTFPLGIRYDKISTISVDDELFKSYFYLIYLLLNKRQKSLDLSLFKSFNSNCGYK